ncbi:MAG TPA: acyl-CoA dehydrogenase family protein [Candidatus Binatia bacterium]|nr:acyl-CoA dehydrogenase family protein [Candidatus Binatia bacterium]
MAIDDNSFAAMLEMVRRFVAERLQPLENELERTGTVPQAIVAEMRTIGLFGLTIPEEYGGFELNTRQASEIDMTFAQTSPAFSLVFAPNAGLGSRALVLAGTEEQKNPYLPRLASGELSSAFCLTEAEAGSDAASLRTRAVRDGDAYVISGSKRFITNAPRADVFTVMARTGSQESGAAGISAFIIEKGTAGLRLGKPERKMGQHGSDICDVIFDDVRVPVDQRIGPEGEGFKIAMRVLNRGRIHIAASAVGMMKRMIDESSRYALTRKQFGSPIADFQLVQAMLADSETEYHAGRALLFEAADAIDAGADARQIAACAKYFCSEAAGRVADRTVQIFGGAGYVADYPAERFYRDARVLRIYEGTSQILQLAIARTMLQRY